MMKTAFLIFLVLAPGVLFAQDSKNILAKIDAQVTFMNSDYSAQVDIVQDKPNEGQSFTRVDLFRRDKDSEYLMLVLKPDSDKGKGYLKIGNNLWLYDPVAHRFTVTSAKDRFQNSNARNSDFTRSSLAEDYRIVRSYPEKLGVFDTTVYELEAIRDDVTFPRTKLWVTPDNLVRMTKDYSLSGQLLRITAIPTYQKVGNRYVPVKMLIIDELRGKMVNGRFEHEKTQITISKPSLDPLPDIVFTRTYLEKMAP
jgi:outer membrane lipoprotein-sorting protein